MDAEDTYDGGRNYRPCMDSFGVDQFQGIMEKLRKIALADGQIFITEMTKKQREILQALNLCA